jgi:hypothetical protein
MPFAISRKAVSEQSPDESQEKLKLFLTNQKMKGSFVRFP